MTNRVLLNRHCEDERSEDAAIQSTRLLRCARNDGKQIAFTLAEVLITLGVIGIVAAMTLPTLIANHRVKQYETQLKKTYTVVINGFRHMMANEGCSDIECLGIFNDGGNTDVEFNEKIDNAVKKAFNVVRTCKAGDEAEDCQSYRMAYLKGGSTTTSFGKNYYHFMLSDGAIVLVENMGCSDVAHPEATKYKKRCGWIRVDTNGKKGPNVDGKDVFGFGTLYDNGDINPDTSLIYAKTVVGEAAAKTYGGYWRNNPSNCGKPGIKLKNDTSIEIRGQNCLARIMENNWEMDYLH